MVLLVRGHIHFGEKKYHGVCGLFLSTADDHQTVIIDDKLMSTGHNELHGSFDSETNYC